MSKNNWTILAINPGSTSTKFGVYSHGKLEKVWTVNHTQAELEPYLSQSILAQRTFRTACILEELKRDHIDLQQFDAFVGRGGLLPPLESGTYLVTEEMLDTLALAERGEHASNLGAIIAHSLAKSVGVNAYIVDPISVNERTPLARLSGLQGIERGPFCHALNSKAVAKRYATEQETAYKDLTLIVAHLGGGICISAHQGGKMIDVTDASQEGPFSPERAGTLPVMSLVELCFSGQLSKADVKNMLMGQGGIYSYLQTKDLREVLAKVDVGDKNAQLVFDGMVYQICKEIGAMSAVLRGQVDAILLTGGMAHSSELTAQIKQQVAWIAPIEIYPGEEELSALSEGVVRVLAGVESVKYLRSAQADAYAEMCME